MKNLLRNLLGLACISFAISTLNAEPAAPSPPQLIKNPATTELYSSPSRQFTGIPSLAITDQGRLWAVWYAGITPAEDMNNYVVVATSGDKGKTWEEVLAIDPDGTGPIKAFDPQVWIDPEGKLSVFWSQRSIHEENCALFCITADNPDSGTPSWSEPRYLTEGIMMNKPTVLSNGEWLLPVSTYKKGDSVKTVVSTDHGRTWSVRSSVNVPEDVRVPDEPMIIERKDGSLWMLVRTKYGIGQTVSKDKGVTWTPLEPSQIQHTPSRFFIRRLASGNLLLVKHGPINTKTARSHLMAFVSKDDGRSWSKGLLLDERDWVTYPDGQQAKDGTIYITYDYLRKKNQLILMTSFTEDDILANDYDAKIVEVFKRRSIISDGGEKEDSGPNPKPPTAAKEPATSTASGTAAPRPQGEVKEKTTPVVPATTSQPLLPLDGGIVDTIAEGVPLWTDREYLAAGWPIALQGATCVRTSMESCRVQITKKGYVVVVTPVLGQRGGFSEENSLSKAGFLRVDSIEPFVPFAGGNPDGNTCCVYQREMGEGEELGYGKWGITLWLEKQLE